MKWTAPFLAIASLNLASVAVCLIAGTPLGWFGAGLNVGAALFMVLRALEANDR